MTLEIVSDKQSTTARVLDVVPLNDENTSWLLGMEMEQAGNFWGIKYAPADWTEEEAAPAAAPVAPVAKPAAAAPAKAPTKEIPATVLRRLLAECRLAAISLGACYLQTGTTFPVHAPVKVAVVTANSEHSFRGSVRVEHVGSGMGIEFLGQGDEHRNRIAGLIEALSAIGDKQPNVSVELAAPDKNTPLPSKSASAAAAQYDSLLGLILVGGSLKRSDFLRELEKQRRKG